MLTCFKNLDMTLQRVTLQAGRRRVPDEPFQNYGALKSVARRSWNSSIHGSWGSIIGKGSSGGGIYPFWSICRPSDKNTFHFLQNRKEGFKCTKKKGGHDRRRSIALLLYSRVICLIDWSFAELSYHPNSLFWGGVRAASIDDGLTAAASKTKLGPLFRGKKTYLRPWWQDSVVTNGIQTFFLVN